MGQASIAPLSPTGGTTKNTDQRLLLLRRIRQRLELEIGPEFNRAISHLLDEMIVANEEDQP
jgi:hypothetical protein